MKNILSKFRLITLMHIIFVATAGLILASCGGGGGGGGGGGAGPIASSKAMTAFTFSTPAATGTINESAKTIALTVPAGTNVTALVATFTTTGSSVQVGSAAQVSGTTPNDFTSPVAYTVIAADSTTAQYTVTVTIASASSKAITSYSILGVAGVINETAKTIAVTLPSGTSISALTAKFTSTGASVTVSGTAQTSATTQNNFASPVIYTVIASDNSTAQYTVTISVSTSGVRDFTLKSNNVSIDLPSVITFSFQVKDQAGKYVSSLSTSDFYILEDGLAIAPSESFQELVPLSQIPYTLKTVLLIDVSASINTTDLANMKTAALNMVANLLPHQQIAVYKFDDTFTQVATFTNNKTTLNTAINALTIGNPSTNLYGAISNAVSLWTDSTSATQITKGFLVAITDGADTAGISTLNAALASIGTKSVYTIGAGAQADTGALTSLGNAGYLSISDYSKLQPALTQISANVAAEASSFYFMHYSTPKRSGAHNLTLGVANNTNTSTNATIKSSFSASGFSSITPLSSFAITPSPTTVSLGLTQQLTATGTLLSTGAPQYLTNTTAWSSSDTSIATVSSTGLVTGVANGTATIFATAPAGNMFKFASASVTVADLPPTVPANLLAAAASLQISLSWSASTDADLTPVAGYKIYRDGIYLKTVTGISAVETGLTNNTTYCYTVSAIDTANNESAKSSQSCALFSDWAPTIVANLTSTGGATQVSLTWTASTDADATPVAGYKIYRGGTYFKTVTGTTTVDTGLTNNTTYCYKVSAIDTAGNESAQSAQSCALFLDSPPTVVVNFTATGGATQVYLSWAAATDTDSTGIAGYKIYRGGTYLKTVTGTNTFDASLTTNTTYCYTVSAIDTAGYESAQSTQSCALTTPHQFAYAANSGNGTISVYTINATTGALSAGTAVNNTGSTPYSVAVDPTGKFAYVANASSNSILVYTINPATGALTAGTAVSSEAGPESVAVDPTGKFAYVANIVGTISAYTINASTGALTSVGAAVAAGLQPSSVTVDPTGKFAYAANYVANTISVYTINSTSGALTAGTAVSSGAGPRSVTVDQTGKFAYAANEGSNNISVYTIDQTTGALTAGTAVSSGSSPLSVTVDPTGKFAYAANSGNGTISVYSINSTTGALTAGTAVAAGAHPTSVKTTGPL